MNLHPGAWWLWALGLAVAASRTTNVLLLSLLVAVVCLVVVSCRTNAPWALAFRVYLVLGAVVVAVRVFFRIVFGGTYVTEGDHVLLRLPSIELPAWTSGVTLLGPITAESLMAGFSDGLRLAAVIICVGAANSLADPRRLLAGMPPALYEVATAVVIAISLFPQLAESIQRVRRARLLRGDPGKGIGALRRVVVPVLEDALDRSMDLAASMDARGYGRTGDQTRLARAVTGGLLVTALLGLCVGAYAVLDSTAPRILAGPMLVLGLALAAAGFVSAGRRVARTRYRPDTWGTRELATAGSGLAAAVLMTIAARQTPQVVLPSMLLPPLALTAVAASLVGLVALASGAPRKVAA